MGDEARIAVFADDDAWIGVFAGDEARIAVFLCEDASTVFVEASIAVVLGEDASTVVGDGSINNSASKECKASTVFVALTVFVTSTGSISNVASTRVTSCERDLIHGSCPFEGDGSPSDGPLTHGASVYPRLLLMIV